MQEQGPVNSLLQNEDVDKGKEIEVSADSDKEDQEDKELEEVLRISRNEQEMQHDQLKSGKDLINEILCLILVLMLIKNLPQPNLDEIR